jgi:hypothetical protein
MRSCSIMLQMIEYALNVVCHFWNEFDARHGQRAILRGDGRLTFLPAARSSR